MAVVCSSRQLEQVYTNERMQHLWCLLLRGSTDHSKCTFTSRFPAIPDDIARVRRSAFLLHVIFGEVARVHPSRRFQGDGESKASNIDTHSEACVLRDDAAVTTRKKLRRNCTDHLTTHGSMDSSGV